MQPTYKMEFGVFDFEDKIKWSEYIYSSRQKMQIFGLLGRKIYIKSKISNS
jgi:hypothetical protein